MPHSQDAMEDLNGRTFEGRDLRISIDEGRPRGGGGSWRGGGGRGHGGGYGDRNRDRGYDSRDRGYGGGRDRDRRDRSDSRYYFLSINGWQY